MRKLLVGLLCLTPLLAEAQLKENTLYAVSTAHFDTQWHWDARESISKHLRATLQQNFFLLERYPHYIFNFEGAVRYSWMKEYYPLEYERVKEYIRQGRWHVAGASWDANDTWSPSPESFFRNILLGQEFYKKEFGLKSTDIFLPDCFGFNQTIPTIANHCGLMGFSTQKLELQRQAENYPDGKVIPFRVGLWQGVDGSKLLSVLGGGTYITKWDPTHAQPGFPQLSMQDEIPGFLAESPNRVGFHYYGVGDKGGSPLYQTVDMVEKAVTTDKPKGFTVISATSDQMFKAYQPLSEHPELETYDGELLLERHAAGSYTSQGNMKKFNHRNEQLADAAERASVVAELLGGYTYPADKLRNIWQTILLHQFHDDLPGTSNPAVYQLSYNDEILVANQLGDIITAATASVAEALDTRVKGMPVVVFNPSAYPRKDIVKASVPMSSRPKGVEVRAANGTVCASQLLSYADGKAEVEFVANMPAVGYGVFDLCPGSDKAPTVKVSERSIENSVYKVELDDNGDIASLYDKRYKKELVAKGRAIRLAVFRDNPSTRWPAWEIYYETLRKEPSAVNGNVRITVDRRGELGSALKVERTIDSTRIVQYIRLSEGANADRLDIDNEIDWRSTNTLLKAEFALGVSNPEAIYDLGLGIIRRGNNTPAAYEVPAARWVDLSDEDGSYGVSILTDYKNGWDKPSDNTIRLTLMHGPGIDPKKTGVQLRRQGRQDYGHHKFTYSIVGHASDYVSAGIVRKAYDMNNPMMAFNTARHEGSLGRSFSLLSCDNDAIEIKAIKKAESGRGYVLRAFETSGREVRDISINFAFPLTEAATLNGIEETQGTAMYSGSGLTFTATRFSPHTFGFQLQGRQAVAKQSVQPLPLPYNASAYTPDAWSDIRYVSNFDGLGNSYAWDIVPGTIDSEGVAFTMGRLEDKNVLMCAGDTLHLPGDGKWRTLYLLASSAKGDKKAAFTVDGKTTERTIPFWRGYYGQWGYDRSPSYVRNGSVAYIGSHIHNRDNGVMPYDLSYIYKIAIPLQPDSRTVILPADRQIAVFAATLSSGDNERTVPAAPYWNF